MATRWRGGWAIALGLVLPGAAVGQSTVERRIRADVAFLADDLLEGRGTPSRGLDMAALYLANQLRAAGWNPALGDGYLQTYPVHEFAPRDAEYAVSIGEHTLAGEDFVLLPFGIDPAGTPRSFPLVFTGWGVAAPERDRDDLKGAALRDAAALALHGAPWDLEPGTPFGYDRAVGKSIASVGAGAGLLVYVTHEFDAIRTREALGETAFAREMENVPYAYLEALGGRPTMGLGPILFVPPRVFDAALAPELGADYEGWQARLADGEAPQRTLEARATLEIRTEGRRSEASNVLATLPGSDPELADEWVVLSAHYDHLGSQPAGPGEDGIWNGADDNASGTAALLEVARRLAGEPPRRSLLVFFTSGEDRGLLGSAHYAENPVVPFEDVAVNVNVDMVGRSTGGVQGIAPGSPGLFEKTRRIGARHRIEVVTDQQPSWRILYLLDSYHFARFDVPVIEFFTGLHPDYHQPSDEIGKIRFAELARLVDVIEELTRDYAGGEAPPEFTRPDWFTTP